MAETQVDGKRAFYTTGGKPWEAGLPLLLLLHGAGGAQTVWINQSRAIAHGGWNVAALDLPGHGFSEDQPGMESVEDYAAWSGRFISALSASESAPGARESAPGVERAVVAGHSMGAAIALTLAATEPSRVAGLILMGIRAEMEVTSSLLEDTAQNPLRAAQFISAFGHAPSTHLGMAPVPGHWMMGSVQALVEACPSPVLHRDFAASNNWAGGDYAGKVACPTLVLTGAQDRMTPAKKGRQLAEAIPGAAYENIPAAGHFLMSEAPRHVLKSMRAFLDGMRLDGVRHSLT